MRKKIIFRLSVLIVFLTVLWSCHNEDFAKGETEPQRNNANFFKHTKKGGINAKSGVDYISILEAYNREKDFLSTMPDQQGMPIWDKMQVLDISDKTVLYVPLSSDKTELSSLLIVKVDENNSVFHVQNFTNDYLKAYVYNADYPKENRKLLMDTFLQMDFFTFGHQEFTNLPKDLYEGSTEYNRLNIMDAKKGTEQNKMFIYTTVCTTFHYCVHGQSASTCDYANCNCGGFIHCFLVTSCSTTATWIDDDPFPSFPGGGGGGGGGTPGPAGIPPKDPCSLNTVFYRLAPGCGGSNGNTEVSLLDDPCDKTRNLLQNADVNDKINTLYAQSKLTPPNNGEKAFKSSADGSTTSPIIVGGEHSADLGDITGYAGYYHNHTPKGVKMLSPPDIYKLFQFIASQPTGTPVNTSFGGMVATEVCAGGCPDGYEYINFLIRFDGTLAEALAIKNRNYTEADLENFKDKFEQFERTRRNASGYSSQNGNFLSFKGLEEVFFYALDKMEIDKNKIILQRINKDGKVYNVTLDTNGKPQETPCTEL